MSVLDDPLLQTYVEESLEHLADIENDLLAIEQSGKDIDEELVNKVFRAAHSIKGGAGFLKLSTISDLSHKLENVLGLIRDRKLVPCQDVVSALLEGFDALGNLIENVRGNSEIEVSDQIAKLSAITTFASPPAAQQEDAGLATEVSWAEVSDLFGWSESELLSAQETKGYRYLCQFDLIEDVHQKGKSPLELLDDLESACKILDCSVDVRAAGTLSDEAPPETLPFLLLLATVIEPDLMGLLCEIPGDRIRRVHDGPTPEAIDTQPRTEATSASPTIEGRRDAGTPGPDRQPVSDGAAAKNGNTPASASKMAGGTLRVNVGLLDALMTLAGELVLGRNQLLDAAISCDERSLARATQKIDLVTSELQETIMLTRMQPVGNIFGRFQRVVRDIGKRLGKRVSLVIEGSEVELDKTIIEGLNDPLTHLVRNAVDHGIEPPDVRSGLGKEPVGEVCLRAYHEAGQVNIEICDDGRGLDGDKIAAKAVEKGLVSEDDVSTMSGKERVALIFLPGFSTAETVTDVSGRGVGMDVVKTNLDKLGGLVEIDSEVGRGTRIRVKLPLTLAIIPSQIVRSGCQRFAIPQVNVDEFLRIPADKVKDRIERVGEAEVVRLRGRLLPLADLNELLGLEPRHNDPKDGIRKVDHQLHPTDRTSDDPPRAPLSVEVEPASPHGPSDLGFPEERRRAPDRRELAGSTLNIVVVSAGAFKYGMVVDELLDAEEIVLKPLGRHLNGRLPYAGATIMGDGRVALILDALAIAQLASLTSLEEKAPAGEPSQAVTRAVDGAAAPLLLFRSAGEEQFAVPLDLVVRIERIQASSVEHVNGRRVLQYQGGALPLFSPDDLSTVESKKTEEDLSVLVMMIPGRNIGLLANGSADAVQSNAEFDTSTLARPGIAGSAIIGGRTTLLVDVIGLVKAVCPEWFEGDEGMGSVAPGNKTILLAEDSAFFRNHLSGFLAGVGYNVLIAEDGLAAWELLQERGFEISLVLTDIQMPRMDGLELTRKIKDDHRLSRLPVIAITTLADDADVSRGLEAGVDDYQIKLNGQDLLRCVSKYTADEVESQVA